MEWTGLNELREKYLSFFESKGHLRLPSFSLVPQGDKSLLLINAGIREVVYSGEYAFLDTVKDIFKQAGVKHRRFKGKTK